MAIEFARIEILSRSSNGNACRSGAYNGRCKITDIRSGSSYNFERLGDNVYHEVLLPEGVDEKFKDLSVLMNAVELSEKRADSQLLKSFVIALPDDKELSVDDRIEITKRIVNKMRWVENGLGVVIDVHEPHDGERNWHAHGLVLTRRFSEDGKELGSKARDLNPKFCGGRVIPEESLMKDISRDVINDYFIELGLDNRVDEISTVPGEHLGPVRMRNILNSARERNELRAIAHLENIKDECGVLDRVTRRQAIFTKKDLEKMVKEIDCSNKRKELVEKALLSDRVIRLFHSPKEAISYGKLEGRAGGNARVASGGVSYYTTKEVRGQEEMAMRIASHVNDFSNYGKKTHLSSYVSMAKREGVVSDAQYEVLKELLLKDSGVRVLRGRAGTGKSHVLGVARMLSEKVSINVIGLAPTHKATEELSKRGFNNAYTVKSLLFSVKNGRLDVPAGSLLIVDEAGMIDTASMVELLKLASSRNCNIIFAGDEKQLASVERGGMFKIFADRFSSCELSEIRRQEAVWGREMAASLARHDIRGAIKTLIENDGLRVDSSLESSCLRLVKDFSESNFSLKDKCAVTLRNIEVDILNRSIREELKGRGLLDVSGGSYNIIATYNRKGGASITNEYCKGERILFTITDKALGIKNGDFGTLLSVSKDKFVVMLDSGLNLSFNPKKMSNFTYGYATTVYKAQGASIKSVYVLHNGVGNSNNSYVSLTRHIEKVMMYCNEEATRSIPSLISQLEGNMESSTSLSLLSFEDAVRISSESNKQPSSLETLKKMAISMFDRLHYNSNYYNYKNSENSDTRIAVEKIDGSADVRDEYDNIRDNTNSNTDANELSIKGIEKIDKLYKDDGANINLEDGVGLRPDASNLSSSSNSDANLAVNNISSKGVRGSSFSSQRRRVNFKSFSDYESKVEMENLRKEMSNMSDLIACNLLGNPNNHLSNERELRFGKNGKIVVIKKGSNKGMWYDFSEGIGGDMLSLVMRERNCDFASAREYGESFTGMWSRSSKMSYLNKLRGEEIYKESIRQDENERSAESRKIKRAHDIFKKTKVLSGLEIDHVVNRYLSNERGIENIVREDLLSSDLRVSNICDKERGQYYDCFTVIARDIDGKITGGQNIYLDGDGRKANIGVNKRSFGKISGSFVNISSGKAVHGNDNDANNSNSNIIENDDHAASLRDRKDNIVIIAEGVETALSIQEAMVKRDVRILCSLGVGNIKNYIPAKGERVLIAADNDGLLSSSSVAINKAKELLEEKGAIVNIVMPNKEGDFNDVLRDHGREEVRSQIFSGLKDLEREKNHENNPQKAQENNNEKRDEKNGDKKHTKKQGRKRDVNHHDDHQVKNSATEEYRNKVDAIRRLKPSYDINLLKEEVLSLRSASEQKACVDKVYFAVLEEKIVSSVRSIKGGAGNRADDNNILEKIEGHISVMKERNINAGEKIVDLLKSGPSSVKDVKHLEDMLFVRCQDHMTKEIKDDLHHIREHKFVEKVGQRFENHRSYLNHVMHDREIGTYLEGTKIEHEFTKLSKGSRVRQQDYSKAHEHTKTHEKDYSMGM